MMTKSNFNNPLILAIETSGRMGSVALAQGERLLGERHFSGPMRHSAEVFPAILWLLERFGKMPADIEQVYISVGPGSFTGLRIAVAIAKTMALASGAKIVAVDTLDIIAANVISFTAESAARPPQQRQSHCRCGGWKNAEKECVLKPNERLAAILDAKRGQFFIAVYDKTRDAIWQKILPDCLMTTEEFLERVVGCGAPIALAGEGLVYYKDKFADPAVRFIDEKYWNPTAANVHRLGWHKAQLGDFADAISLLPNYLRGPDVKVKQG
jgi:tRNA threonylcarbamoyladenosine biosynthesis protein TsaB